ncbi:unnamed protein product [Allacma fusca]|uniref:Exonuclease domain-containing protein n=1 Tax=Allacma fusca TaxID=39272 RepID=A0A8J2KYS1_9HEXA|nr:unnamed protein product [Allacma fusca]
MALSLDRYRFAALPHQFHDTDPRLTPRNSPRLFQSSSIINNERIMLGRKLYEWYGSSKQQSWRCIYRASLHGSEADSFHNHCDGIAPTYVVALIQNMSRRSESNWDRTFEVTSPTRHKKGFTVYRVISKVFPRTFPEGVTTLVVWKRSPNFQKQDLSVLVALTEIVEERKKSAYSLLEFAPTHSQLFTSKIFVQFFEHGYHVKEQAVHVVGDQGDAVASRGECLVPERLWVEKETQLVSGNEDDTISVSSAGSSTAETATFTDSDSMISTLVRCIYRASLHGYEADFFHNHCDGIAPTYVVALIQNDVQELVERLRSTNDETYVKAVAYSFPERSKPIRQKLYNFCSRAKSVGRGVEGIPSPCPRSSPKSAWETDLIYRGDLIPKKRKVFIDVEKVTLKSSTKHEQVAATVAVVDENRELIFWAIIHRENICQYFPNITGLTEDKIKQGIPADQVNLLLAKVLDGNTVYGASVYNDLVSLGLHTSGLTTVDIQTFYRDDKGPISLNSIVNHLFPTKSDFQCAHHSAISDARMTCKVAKRMLKLQSEGHFIYPRTIKRVPSKKMYVGDSCKCCVTRKKYTKKSSRTPQVQDFEEEPW